MQNSTFEEMVEYIKDEQSFAVCGHVNPDGDCIGSVLAMTCALRQAGKNAVPLLANSSPVPAKYGFLDGSEDFMHASHYKEDPDVFISVDTPFGDRMGEGLEVMGRAKKVVQIDHHPGDGVDRGLFHIDTSSASASMLVWEFAVALLGTPDVNIATACYTGLLTDTGRFQFQNTDARALNCASQLVSAGTDPALVATEVYEMRPLPSLQLEGRLISRIEFTSGGRIAWSWVEDADYVELGAKKEDTEGLVDVVRSVEGIDIAVLVRGRSNSVRCSIRAKRDLDVSVIASKFGGGGHKAASGFTVPGTLDKVRDELVDTFERIDKLIVDGNYPEGL
ncbi:MAG: DHH family phosphoesterase [Coriobacteriales bacterium]